MDRQIIRDLAGRYMNLALSDRNAERVTLTKGVNDLRMIRPIAVACEIPWHEMNIDGQLDLKCEDEKMRELESFFRMKLLEQKYFPCDSHLRTYFPVLKKGAFGRMTGLEIDERQIKNPAGGYISAHEYHDVLANEDDLEKLHWVPGYYDREATVREFEFVADIVGDIIPVKITGHQVAMGHTLWDDVAQYRGVANLLSDLIERPEFMHRIARKLTDGYIKTVEDAVKNNMYAQEYPDLHCSPAYTNDLAPVTDYDRVKPENIWGRGVAQIFGFVSPEMHDEFDTRYMAEALKPFGLVYYGCCERLDNKIHLLKKMGNLRKISITPWSDINNAAEQMGKDYVMSVKLNPANVGAAFDEDVIRKEFGAVFDAAKRNGCAFEIILKDISTVANRPQNLIRWAEIATEAVNNF